MKIEEVYAREDSGPAHASRATTYFLVDREVPNENKPRAMRVEDHKWPFDNTGYWKVDMWVQTGWTHIVNIQEKDAVDASEALDLATEILGWES